MEIVLIASAAHSAEIHLKKIRIALCNLRRYAVKNNFLMIMVACLVLTACGGSSGRAVEVRPVNYEPSIVSFDMTDSYGVDTATSNWALEIDPYIDDGLFDLRWRVNSLEDYEANILVNSRPTSQGSILIYSDVCGAGLSCDQADDLICQYTEDSTLSCGRGPVVSIKSMPVDLYLIFQVCDLNPYYCYERSYPVAMLL